MSAVAFAVLALAAATMRNGSAADLDAVVYTIAYWGFVLAAVLMIAY